MNQTYAERRAQIFFQSARDLYRLAGEILDDVREDAELLGKSVHWAVVNANSTEMQARAMEERGHEQSITTAAQETHLRKARAKLYQSRDDFGHRLALAKERRAAHEAFVDAIHAAPESDPEL